MQQKGRVETTVVKAKCSKLDLWLSNGIFSAMSRQLQILRSFVSFRLDGHFKTRMIRLSIPGYFYFWRYPFLPQFLCGKCCCLIQVPGKFHDIDHEHMSQ